MHAQSLFHFTKRIETLKAILQDRFFWPQYCLEDVSWIRSRPGYAAFAMTCFCDIPLSMVSDHTDYYGQFGLGLTKTWGLKNGLNPIIYLNEHSPLKNCLNALFRHADHQYEGVGPTAYLDAIELAAYIKPYHGMVRKGDSEVSKRFYDESEWRYIPHEPYTRTDHFYDTIDHPELNRLAKWDVETRKYPLKFTIDDIKYIFVPIRHNISEIIAHLQAVFAGVSQDVLASMVTRIVTLEELKEDI